MRGAPFRILVILGISLAPACAQGDADLEMARQDAALYSALPDVSHCIAGALTEREKTLALDTVNDIRRLHGLAPVTYDSSYDGEVMQVSLMMVAEDKVSHRPLPAWKCFSQPGYDGAQSSNLGQWKFWSPRDFVTTDRDIAGWLTDTSNALAGNVGHRRWLLDPFLKRIAYGRVSQIVDGRMIFASALKILYMEDYQLGSPTPPPPAQAVSETRLGPEARSPGAGAAFVAYPYGDYPSRYFDRNALLSFAVVVNPDSIVSRHAGAFDNSKADYSAATVSVRERGGEAVAIRDQKHDEDWVGLPNNLQFAAPGLKPGVTYDVAVHGVKVAGVVRDYDYWFRIAP